MMLVSKQQGYTPKKISEHQRKDFYFIKRFILLYHNLQKHKFMKQQQINKNQLIILLIVQSLINLTQL